MKKATIKELLNLYDNELSKSIKNKKKLNSFELRKMEYITYCVECLNNPNYKITKYNIFMIYEPKKRIVMSLNICDKLINHYFTKNVLMPFIEPKLIDRNVATRTGRGTKAGIDFVKKDIECLKQHGEVFALKIDISKFFYTIDHDVLLNMLKKLGYDDYIRVKNIIDSTDEDYVNENILKLNEKNNCNLPLYNKGKGLPIGNLSSQCLSIFLTYKLDYYIIHSLGCKHYVKYMDDYIILSNDKEKLKKVKSIIIDKLVKEYKLKINYKKTFIVSLNNGVEFLGRIFRVKDNKTIISIRKSSLKIMKKNIRKGIIKYKKDKSSFEYLKGMIMNYSYSTKCNTMIIRKYINKYL